MAFPTYASGNSQANSAAGTSLGIGKPAGVAVGNLLLALIRLDGTVSSFTAPSGWTVVFNDTSDPTDDHVIYAWKVADGTEAATITFTWTTSVKALGYILRITGQSGDGDDNYNLDTGVSPIPYPTLAPSGGAKDYLWIYFGSREGESATVSLPTDFSDIGALNTGTAGAADTNLLARAGYKQQNTASLTPSGTSSNTQAALLIAISPVGGFPHVLAIVA